MVLGNGIQDPQQEHLIGPAATHRDSEIERRLLLVADAHT
jgi:hypothetical protein